ncbi:MAG: hypothetical protein K1X83_05035 [Oligoflexia bacterium]|nr:hypothetical protein [Oligoflexia bacterium]
MIKKYAFLLALVVPLVTSCGGGGGGGGDFIGAANVSIDASPTEFDTGDRTQVEIHISDVNDNGIALKVRFPDKLEYVPSSAILVVDGEELDISPTVNSRKDQDVYLVFYLSQDLFGGDGSASGTVSLQLEATGDFSSNTIEADADVDDPLIGNNIEFDLENPEFAPEDQVEVQVVG